MSTRFYSMSFLGSILFVAGITGTSKLQAQAPAAYQITFDGIQSPFPVSVHKKHPLRAPDLGLFYPEKQIDVAGYVHLSVPPKHQKKKGIVWADGSTWLKYINLETLTKTSFDVGKVGKTEYIPIKNLSFRWGRPRIEKARDKSLGISVRFVLKQRNGKSLAPGQYILVSYSFGNINKEKAPFFYVINSNTNNGFVVSHLKTKNDYLNLYQGRGDRWASRPLDLSKGSKAAWKEKQKNRKLARIEYRKFLKLQPDDDLILMRIAKTYAQAGQHQQTIEVYQEVIKVWKKTKKLGRITHYQRIDPRGPKYAEFLRGLEQSVSRLQKHLASKKKGK